jgi:hypothetical protein
MPPRWIGSWRPLHAEELAECSEECMFCLTEPGMGATARVVETETAETLARFIAFASPHLKIQTV